MVACTKCTAVYDLSHISVAMAIGTGTSFIEYLRWIQNSKCPSCKHKETLG